MKKILFFLISFIIAVCSIAARASEVPVFIRGTRPLGMGGAFVAISDDQNAVFYNPAGLTQRQGGFFSAFELPVNISEDALKFYDFYKDNEDNLKNFDNLPVATRIDLLNQINDTISRYSPRVRVGFPNTCYLSGPGFLSWGLGLFNQEDISFQFNQSLIVPNISMTGDADVLLAAPLAHRFDHVPFIPGKVSAGVTLKYLNRAKISELNKSVLEFDNLDPTLQWGNGFGADLGAMYQPNDRLNVGLQITDFGGTSIKFAEVKSNKAGEEDKPAETGMIPSQMNVGAAYIPSKIFYWPGRSLKTQDRLILALDVRDIGNSDERLLDATFFKKLHMGLEFRWGPVSLRGGINSGYFSFGAGVRIPYLGLKADYAYWGDELGRYAGQQPQWNHQITLALSWGDGKGRLYGSDFVKKAAQEEGKKVNEQQMKNNLKGNPASSAAPADAKAASMGTPVTPVVTPASPVSTPSSAAGTPATATGTPAPATPPAGTSVAPSAVTPAAPASALPTAAQPVTPVSAAGTAVPAAAAQPSTPAATVSNPTSAKPAASIAPSAPASSAGKPAAASTMPSNVPAKKVDTPKK